MDPAASSSNLTAKPKLPDTPLVKAGKVYDQISRLCGWLRHPDAGYPGNIDIQTGLEELGRLAETEEARALMEGAVMTYVLAAQFANLEVSPANKGRVADIAAELLTQCKRVLSTAYPIGF